MGNIEPGRGRSYIGIMGKKKRKLVRREERVSARVTTGLYAALEERAVHEEKKLSEVVVAALRAYLDYKASPPPSSEK
jgi:hypothetical protein